MRKLPLILFLLIAPASLRAQIGVALPWNDIANPIGNQSLNMGAYSSTWSWTGGYKFSASGTGQISLNYLESIRYADDFNGADCTAKINAAEADLGATPGEIWVNQACGLSSTTAPTISNDGHIVRVIQPGTYSFSALITFSGNDDALLCDVRGDNNHPGTTLKETNSSNLATFLSSTGYNFRIENCGFDGNQANNSTAHDGIVATSAKLTLQGMAIHDFKRHNISLGASTEGTHIDYSMIVNAGSNGIEVAGGATDAFLDMDEVANNGQYNLHTGAVGGFHIIGGDYSGTTGSSDCIFMDGTASSVNNPQIIGVAINPCYGHAIHLINANQPVVSSNYITNPGTGTNNTFDGILITNFGNGTIAANAISDGSTACSGHSCMRYGVNISAQTAPSSITGNQVSGAQTLAINAAVTNDLAGNSINASTGNVIETHNNSQSISRDLTGGDQTGLILDNYNNNKQQMNMDWTVVNGTIAVGRIGLYYPSDNNEAWKFYTYNSGLGLRLTIAKEVATFAEPVSATTGFQIAAAATSNHCLLGNGTNYVDSANCLLSGGALGTPSSGTATNLTGLPLSTGVTGVLPNANGGLGIASGAAMTTSAMGAQSTATPTGITNMTWSIGASKNYILNCYVPVTLASSATISFALGGPGTATSLSIIAEGAIGAASVWAQKSTLIQTAWASTATPASSAVATDSVIHVWASIQNGSTASGTALTLQTIADGTHNITVGAGATCVLNQVN